MSRINQIIPIKIEDFNTLKELWNCQKHDSKTFFDIKNIITNNSVIGIIFCNGQVISYKINDPIFLCYNFIVCGDGVFVFNSHGGHFQRAYSIHGMNLLATIEEATIEIDKVFENCNLSNLYDKDIIEFVILPYLR